MLGVMNLHPANSGTERFEMQVNVNRVLIIPLLFLFGCTTGGPWSKQSDTKSWSIQKQSEIVRSGKTAYRFEVRPGDVWGDGFKRVLVQNFLRNGMLLLIMKHGME